MIYLGKNAIGLNTRLQLTENSLSGNTLNFHTNISIPIKNCTLNFSPQQDLHGYNRPWPEGGGDNLIDFESIFPDGWTNSINGLTATYANGIITIIGTSISNAETKIVDFSNVWANDLKNFSTGSYIGADHITFCATKDGNALSNQSSTITVNNTLVVQGFYIPVAAGATVNWDIPLVFVKDTTRPMQYTPYGNVCPITGFTGMEVNVGGDDAPLDNITYTITWQTEAGTAYSGTLNTMTGVLVIDKAAVDLGTLTYTVEGDGNGNLFSTNSLRGIVKSAAWSTQILDAICSIYMPNTGSATYKGTINCTIGTDGNGKIYIYDSTRHGMNASTVKSSLSGILLVYALPTSITKYLDPTFIYTLMGTNVISSDADTIQMTYYDAELA